MQYLYEVIPHLTEGIRWKMTDKMKRWQGWDSSHTMAVGIVNLYNKFVEWCLLSCLIHKSSDSAILFLGIYVLVAQLWESCKPMDCSRPGSSLHRILQARILEWVALLGLSPMEICPCVHQRHVHVHHCGWKTATMLINGHTEWWNFEIATHGMNNQDDLQPNPKSEWSSET